MAEPARELSQIDFRALLATAIRSRMVQLDITQERLAELSGLSTGTINRMVLGKQGYTSQSLEAVAFALQAMPGDLLNGVRAGSHKDELYQTVARMNDDQAQKVLEVCRIVLSST